MSHDNAKHVDAIRADYYKSVRATAEDYLSRQKRGEFRDAEHMREVAECELDQTYWSIYFHAAYQCLLVSDNESDAWETYEDMGGKAERQAICVVAAFAHTRDVFDYMGDLDELF